LYFRERTEIERIDSEMELIDRKLSCMDMKLEKVGKNLLILLTEEDFGTRDLISKKKVGLFTSTDKKSFAEKEWPLRHALKEKLVLQTVTGMASPPSTNNGSPAVKASTDKKSFVAREWVLRRALREQETGVSKVKDTLAKLEKSVVRADEQEKLQFIFPSTDKKSFVAREWVLRRALREQETGVSKVKDTPVKLEKSAVKYNEQEIRQEYQKEGLKHASVWKPSMWVWGWGGRFLHAFDEKISGLLDTVVSKWFFN